MFKKILTVALLAFSVHVMANSTLLSSNGGLKVEDYTKVDTAPVARLNVTSVQEFLLNGTFNELPSLGDVTSNADNYQYHFYEFGMVDIITENLKGEFSIKSLFWNILEDEAGVNVVISDPQTDISHNLKVENIDGQLLSVEYNGHHMVFNATASVSQSEIDALHADLIGSWEVKTYPFDVITEVEHCGAFEKINGAYLSYEFIENGIYTKKVGSNMVAMEEEGVWDISGDGRFLIFYPTIDGNPENTYGSQIAMIKELKNGSLVIGQALSVPQSDFETLFCTAPKDFTMKKIGETSSVR